MGKGIEERIEERINSLNRIEEFKENKIKIFQYNVLDEKIDLSFTIDGKRYGGTNNIR